MRVMRLRPPLIVHPATLGRSRMPRLGFEDAMTYAMDCLVVVIRRDKVRSTNSVGEERVGGRKVISPKTNVALGTALLLAVLAVQMWCA